MEHKNLFDLVEPLEIGRRNALIEFCRDQSFPESMIADIELQARIIREFELHHKEKIPTPKDEVENLNEIALLSKRLCDAIESASSLNLVTIHNSMEEHPLTGKLYGSEQYPWPERVPLLGITKYLQLSLERLESAAAARAAALAPGLRSGGRKSVLRIYAWHVEQIWETVGSLNGYGIESKAKLEKLCDAVFDAAGVRAKSEGAVKLFRKLKKAHGDGMATTLEDED